MRRRLLKTLAVLLLLLAAIAGGGYLYLRRSLPEVHGTIRIGGLSGPVDVVRDADDIPHIFATTRRDALTGLGYAHAQDRLWQMEFQRRIGYGRLSEIFGAATLPQDRFLRTVGFGRAAKAAWDRLPDAARGDLNAYVAGVNAFLAAHHGATLPPEFSLLRFEPEPWQGADVIVWQKMMAWDLAKNYSFELLRHDLAAALGAGRLAELMPPYAASGLSILSDADMPWLDQANPEPATLTPEPGLPDHEPERFSTSFETATARGLPAVADLLNGGALTEALGSNDWVVDGTMTTSGKPLLANDPHLDAHVPSTWYLAHMSAPDFDVIGATLPGTPAVALGRNRFIAWGATNVAADVEDLYREHLDPTGRTAEYQGAQEPLQIIPETIVVKGGAPVHLDVRVSRHGPLVSDAINANNAALPREPRPAPLEPLAFRWTALDPDDTTIVAFLDLNRARNRDEFMAAMREFVVPSQNFVYADVDGHIGYIAPGRIPIRASGDGGAPAEGWTGRAEWTGWIPFDRLPQVFDPPEHFIVTANDRPTPARYPYLIALEWPEAYRAQRITDLIRAGAGRLTPAAFAAIQGDRLSLHAKALLPLLLSRVRPIDDSDRKAADLLRGWNFEARGDAAAPAIFEAWFLRLTPAIAGDEIDPRLLARYQGQFSYVTRFLMSTLADDHNPWCDDVRTPARETCGVEVSAALHAAVDDLTRRLGGDMAAWRWENVHVAKFPHQGLDAVALLRPLLSRSMPNGGDWSTVDVGAVATERPYDQVAIPGYREIIDLSPANDSRFLDAVGESGHFLSPHYDDFMADWRAVRHRPMRMERTEADKGALGTLELRSEK